MLSPNRQEAALEFNDKTLSHQIALINSMTKKERANPALLQASRKKRIAAGAGLDVQELNRLLKMHRQMADTMKKMSKMGKGGMMKQAMKMMGGKGGMPDLDNMSQADIEAAAKAMGGKLPGMGGLPGLGGLGGLSGLGKKK